MLRSNTLASDLSVLILLAGLRWLLHLLTNGQYGFHRDELAILDEARFLAWGYVAYPPVAPLIARVSLELFGPTLVGVRVFSALAQSIAMILAGLMARELGGGRRAQIVTAVATAIAPIALIQGALFQYVSFDYLWWVVIAYLTLRLLNTDNPRWWLAIGAVIGVGMMTKYTLAFLVAGIVGGVALTPNRRYLTSPWLWGGVALSLLIFLPNVIWQARHNFISLEFLSAIHDRDVAIGRTSGFLIEQFIVCANLFTLTWWVMGLGFYLFMPSGHRYRLLGWMYIIPFALLLLAQGRSYYLAPAYPMLIAAGVVTVERWLTTLSAPNARLALTTTWVSLMGGGALGMALMLPVAPINSGLWNLTSQVHDNFVEQIGWEELVETVATIYTTLPAPQRSSVGILTGNYGEAGAINLYGPAHGLPRAISGINSYWLRGYGDPPPTTLIVLGYSREQAERFFTQCDLAGRITNRYGVQNEEVRFHPDIFVCRGVSQPWPILWPNLKRFG